MEPNHLSNPELAALASALSPEAYHALQPILLTLARRIEHQEQQPQFSVPQVQEAMRQALANANITLQNPNGVPTGQNLRIDPPLYRGSAKENVRTWKTLAEDCFRANNTPVAEWGKLGVTLLRDTAQLWYLGWRDQYDGPLTWDIFTAALIKEYDSPYRLDEIREEMDKLRYSGNMTQYCDAFSRLDMRVRDGEMSFGDRFYRFKKGLPADAIVHIHRRTPEKMLEVYEAAREWDRLRPSSSRNVRPSSPKGHHRSFGYSAPRTSSTSHTSFSSERHSAAHTNPSHSLGPGPMDLDNFVQTPSSNRHPPRAPRADMSRIRCYNCHQIGHYAKDCLKKRAVPSNNARTGSAQPRSHPSQPPRQPMMMFEQGIEPIETVTSKADDSEDDIIYQGTFANGQVVDVADGWVVNNEYLQQHQAVPQRETTLEREIFGSSESNSDDDMLTYPPLEAHALEAPLLNLSDDGGGNDEALPFYHAYIACRLPIHRRVFQRPKPWIAVRTILDTGSPSNYISESVLKQCSAEIFPITPREVIGAGKVMTNSFAKFSLRIGNIQEVTLAYVLPAGCPFRYDLLLGRSFMRRHDFQLDWSNDTAHLKCMKTHQISTLRAIPAPTPAFELPNHAIETTRSSTPDSLPDLVSVSDSDNISSLNLDSDFSSSCETLVSDEQPKEEPVKEIDPKPRKSLGAFGARLKTLAKKTFPRLFRSKVGFPPERKWALEIDTGDHIPIKVRGRPHSPPEQETIREFVEDGKAQGIIEPSNSPWSAPILLVPKKDGKTRICVDFRALNAVTRRNAYPLPRIDDSYQNLIGARYFTTLDLKSGYWQVRLSPSAKEKTAFTCRHGHFQFRVMPFGLCNAPALFQNMMNDILQPYIDRCAMVYLDDVIIYSQSFDSHVHDVENVLHRLAEHDLVLNEDKCLWAQTEILYLGHIVSGDGIKPNPDKVKAIHEWPRPTTITHVRGFLNIAGYYRRFIQGFASLARPLYNLLQGAPKKGTPIEWTDDCEQAFLNLKSRLTSPKLLAHPVPWRLFVIDTDASNDTIGAVLQQSQEAHGSKEGENKGDDLRFEYKEKDLRTIAFESRRMTATEQRYSAQEREMLAVVHALQKFRGYIEGSAILVRTDHESLKYVLSQKNPGRRLTRFIDDLSHFDVRIIYRPGRSQIVADALSRIPHDKVETTNSDNKSYAPLYAHPTELAEPSTVPDNTSDVPFIVNPATETEEDRTKLFNTVFMTLEGYRVELLKGTEPAQVGTGQYFVHDGQLFKNISNDNEKEEIVLTPTTLVAAQNIIRSLHHDLAHLGITCTVAALKKRVWIPYLQEIVERTLRTCDVCQFSRREIGAIEPLHPLPRVGPVKIWAFDFIGPLPQTQKGNAYILSWMDLGVDFAYAQALARRSDKSVVGLLRFLISLFGKPDAVLTDNGAEFTSYLVQNFLRRLGIRHLHTTPYHPQTNGRLEKFNDTCVQMLGRYTVPDRQNEWDEYLPDIILAHNAHIKRSLGHSPSYLLYGFEPTLPNDHVYDVVRLPPTDAEIEELQRRRLDHVQDLDKVRQTANERAGATMERLASGREDRYRERALAVGDWVKRKNESQSKLHPRWDGPFIIHNVTDRNTYQLRTSNGYVLRNLYNGTRLSRYHPSSASTPLYIASDDLKRRDERERLLQRRHSHLTA
jgi:hypothetical protein